MMSIGPSAPYVYGVQVAGLSEIGIHRARQPAGDYSEPATNDIVIGQALQDIGHLERDFGTGLSSREATPAGWFEVTPPGISNTIVIATPSETEVAYLSWDFVERLLSEHGQSISPDVFGCLCENGFKDPQLSFLMTEIWTEAQRADVFCYLYVDSLVLALIRRLLELQEALPKLGLQHSRLSRDQMHRVDAYLHDHLDGPPRVSDLATLCDMPRYQFSKSFKATVGTSPHGYVVKTRLARAMEQLRGDKAQLIEVALECGFSSQSHMTDVFTRELGVTPGRYRREYRSQ